MLVVFVVCLWFMRVFNVGVVVFVHLLTFVCRFRFVLCSCACVGVCVVLLCVGLFVFCLLV